MHRSTKQGGLEVSPDAAHSLQGAQGLALAGFKETCRVHVEKTWQSASEAHL